MVVAIFLFLTIVGAQFSITAGCPGYMFLGENSIPTCDQHVTFLHVSKDIITTFGDNNNFAVRGFGSPDSWNPLNDTDKWGAIGSLNDWIEKYQNGHCKDPEAVNFTKSFLFIKY